MIFHLTASHCGDRGHNYSECGDYECLTVTRNHQMNNAEVVTKTDPLSSMVTGTRR